ncbi:MAG: DnaJ domain-containing protein [Aphanothece sp. CMT-3BRIN-NPC111]|nr:DnaJ domain-containing protein [Aphanothece sp. CMT-3BRIN-NPC111]
MNLADCYRLLGLRSAASTAEIKASYRRMARQYHPDINPGDQVAKEKFIKLTQAYKLILSVISKSGISEISPQPQDTDAIKPQARVTKVDRVSEARENKPELSLSEQHLKWSSYQQLQQLLKSRRFARAIALAEGLAQRFPQDPEVRQWQAIAYSSWGHHLIGEKQLDKARIYLKKALRTDPHNRSLWTEVERDFRRIEQLM